METEMKKQQNQKLGDDTYKDESIEDKEQRKY